MLIPEGMRWDVITDVVIIGYGCAGTVVAATARDEGADVVILEKQPSQSHRTNSGMSGGVFLCPSEVKGAQQYLEALYRGSEGLYWTDKDTIRAWAEYAVGNKAWIEARGGNFLEGAFAAEYPELPGHDTMTRYRLRGVGPSLTKFLSEQIQERNIPVMYDTAARKLLTDSSGRVVGVEAESRTKNEVKRVRIGASKGVVLTCGGFEFNEQMKLNYLKAYPTYFTGSEANTGDGIRMAMGVGADLWHMNCVSAWIVMKFPDFPVAFLPDLVPAAEIHALRSDAKGAAAPAKRCGYVFVDRYGKRSTEEGRLKRPTHSYYYEMAMFDSQRMVHPRVPSYWIFDQRRMDLGPLPLRKSGAAGPSGLYKWSRDNGDEIAAGWILTASTMRDLATKLEMSPDVLENTVVNYNRYCERGVDPDFGTNPAELVPIEQPPYYAVRLWPGGANTQGGPKRNGKAEVLNSDGEPIPGLYSAGELGSIYGMLYSGAGNLAECVAFGRIAGENVARNSLA